MVSPGKPTTRFTPFEPFGSVKTQISPLFGVWPERVSTITRSFGAMVGAMDFDGITNDLSEVA